MAHAETFPVPLVPPDLDLRRLPYMPLQIERLERSKAWLACKKHPELAYFMLNLWKRVWRECPVASIEDDPEVIADAAGADPETWTRISEVVLRGWIKCSDGRLYHPVLAELALEAASKTETFSRRGKAGADARWGKASDDDASAPKRRQKRTASGSGKSKKAAPDQTLTGANGTSMQQPMHEHSLGNCESMPEPMQSDANALPDDANMMLADANRTRTRIEGNKNPALPQEIASPSAAAGRPPALSDPDDPVEAVFGLVGKAAENWFDLPDRERHEDDDATVRAWLAVGAAKGLPTADTIAAIGATVDRQFRKLAQKPEVGAPHSLALLTPDVEAAVKSARRNPPLVAVEDRAPEPYAARFTAAQHTSWIKPCTVTVTDGRALIVAPSSLIAERLRVHYDQDLRTCLGVVSIEVETSPPKRKSATSGGKRPSAEVIPHPAMTVEGGSK